MVSHILETNSDLKIEDVREMQRKYWNAFKHATKIKKKKRVEREDDELLQRFTDEHNDAALFVGWVNYARTTKMMPIEARVHHTWWITLNPDNVDPKISLTEYDRSFPQLREKTRAEQKQMLNRKIECVRMQKEHMEHPRTERRPLVLGWNTRE